MVGSYADALLATGDLRSVPTDVFHQVEIMAANPRSRRWSNQCVWPILMRFAIAASLVLPSAAMIREVVSGESAEASSTEEVEVKLSDSGIRLVSQSSRFRQVRAARMVVTVATCSGRFAAVGRLDRYPWATDSGHRLSNGLLAPMRL